MNNLVKRSIASITAVSAISFVTWGAINFESQPVVAQKESPTEKVEPQKSPQFLYSYNYYYGFYNQNKKKLWDKEIVSAKSFFSKNDFLKNSKFKKDGIKFFVGDYFTYFTNIIKKIEKKTEALNLKKNKKVKYYWNPSGNRNYLNFWHTMVKEVSYCSLNLVKLCPYVTKNVVDKYYKTSNQEKNAAALLISQGVQKVNDKFKKLVDDFDYLLEINNISI